MSAAKEPAAISISTQDGSCSGFVFSEQGCREGNPSGPFTSTVCSLNLCLSKAPIPHLRKFNSKESVNAVENAGNT